MTRELAPFRERTLWPSLAWNEMFDRFLGAPFGAVRPWGNGEWDPAVDVKETPEAYTFKLEVPGMKTEDVHIDVTHDAITFSGEKRAEEKRQDDRWFVTERSYGAFNRTFSLPVRVDAEKVEANMKNGVLEVKVQKSVSELPRHVKIKS